MKPITSIAATVIAMTALGPGVALADGGATADRKSPVRESRSATASGVPQPTAEGVADLGHHLQSYYSLKYYLSSDAGMRDGYPQGRSLVIERKGTRVYITILTYQGTPSCFSGEKSGSTYVGNEDSGHPPYTNWFYTIRKTRRGVNLTQSHGVLRYDGYVYKYRHSSKAGIKKLFGWNAWKQHQHYLGTSQYC